MSALIVGGDRIASYRNYLSSRGYATVHHWDGRKPGDCHRQIPQDTQLVVVFIDQVNHGLACKIRRLAGDRELPIIFTRRSIGQLDSLLATRQ